MRITSLPGAEVYVVTSVLFSDLIMGRISVHPESIMKVPFIESIHKAKFAKIPDNFKNLPTTAIAEILKNPLEK